ncbi:pectinesterase family protein [Marinoscillum sp. MHG1-6]|uniref:pectinesterase family protein n=1 Tax=Marinoscillum sp. MHG1-6 TaxID=2959627 RepID=UPI002157AAC1|nr:pectinesterase family protein [Marinoscillum sp. MHG1-6]
MKNFFFTVVLLTGAIFCHAQGYATKITVALDGSGDYSSISEAIFATKAFPDVPITIYVKNGVYEEKVEVFSWNTRLSIIGEDQDSTIITWEDHFGKMANGRNGTFHTYTMLVDANDFHGENLTIINSSGPVGQAVAIHVEGDRVSFTNCSFQGHQDTMYLTGEGYRTYFKNCFISGTTDFIFGQGTAWFEGCEIRSRSNSYITAASTEKGDQFGFVFSNCKLTAEDGVDEVYLGRPWRKYARTVFINCEMEKHILPVGWHEWSNEDDRSTTYYAEYKSFGPGASPDTRISWSKQLSKKEAKAHTRDKVLRGWQP